MPHPIGIEDQERFAIHEMSHAVVVVRNGLMLLAVRLDLTEKLPGANWSIEPAGIWNASITDKEIRVYAAGYLGEERKYGKGHNKKAWMGVDLEKLNELAIHAIGNGNDIAQANKPGITAAMFPFVFGSAWARFEKHIEKAKEEAAAQINADFPHIEFLAERIRDNQHHGRMWGEEVYEVLGVPWPGNPLLKPVADA